MRQQQNRKYRVYAKCGGKCHLCHRRIILSHYGRNDVPSGWHIDHSVPRAMGGTDHQNNLLPACWYCNLSKGARPSEMVRRRNGVAGIPPPRAQEQVESESNVGWVFGLGAIGLLLWRISRKNQPNPSQPLPARYGGYLREFY